MSAPGERISVIIPCYNASATLAACVRSVVATGYPDLEVILVDDVSTDTTPQIIAALQSEFSEQVRAVRQPAQGGPARARNAGADRATGEYLFFLDSDTIMDGHAMERFSQRIREVAAVVGIYEAEPINAGAVARYKAYLNHYFFARGGVIPYEVFDSARAGIRADIFRELGGYNTSLKWGMDFENEELGYRIIKRHAMVLDPDIHVGHHFPGFARLTRTYFTRVAQWMEIFMIRRKFESGGVTSAGTGLSSAALLCALASLPGMIAHPAVGFGSLVLWLVYLWGYSGFFAFVLHKRPAYAPLAIFLNMYFTVVLACGALTGALRVISGRSQMREIIASQT